MLLLKSTVASVPDLSNVYYIAYLLFIYCIFFPFCWCDITWMKFMWYLISPFDPNNFFKMMLSCFTVNSLRVVVLSMTEFDYSTTIYTLLISMVFMLLLLLMSKSDVFSFYFVFFDIFYYFQYLVLVIYLISMC